jgi:serine/threonine protein kinase
MTNSDNFAHQPPEKGQFIDRLFKDRYQIQSLLSHKPGRRTFLAHDRLTNSTVVIKLLLFGVDFNWADLKLFQREAAVLQSLQHPAIPQYIDYFDVETELGQGFALVQTYIEAKSLQEWVESGRTFAEPQLKSIARHLLEILDYLHHQQPPIIHRDIKPSNILLSNYSGNSFGDIYLLDFGSVQTAPSTNTITVVGTYGYMPPEQFGGKTSPASDLYALGATLIYLATGQHPADLPQKDMRISFEKHVTLDQYWIEWLQNLTEPGVDRRINDARQALALLDQPHALNTNYSTGLLSKPKGSRIKTIQTLDKFQIEIPYRMPMSEVATYIFLLVVTSFIFWFFGSTVMYLGLYFTSILAIICMVPCALITFTLLRFIIIGCWSKTLLSITKNKIILEYKILDIAHYRRSKLAQLHDISHIELVPEHFDSSRSRSAPASIIIWNGIKKMEISSRLTTPELNWVVQECKKKVDEGQLVLRH